MANLPGLVDRKSKGPDSLRCPAHCTDHRQRGGWWPV